jgi:hypothetical protein
LSLDSLYKLRELRKVMVRHAVLIISLTLVLPPGWCCWQPLLDITSVVRTVSNCPKCCHRPTSDSKPTSNAPIQDEDRHCPCQSRLAIVGTSGFLVAKSLEHQDATVLSWVATAICAGSCQPATYRLPCSVRDIDHQALFCVWRC